MKILNGITVLNQNWGHPCFKAPFSEVNLMVVLQPQMQSKTISLSLSLSLFLDSTGRTLSYLIQAPKKLKPRDSCEAGDAAGGTGCAISTSRQI